MTAPPRTVTAHPDWPVVAGYLSARKAHGGAAQPRFELRGAPAEVERTAMGMVGRCPYCGRQMHWFRQRASKGGVYLGVSCDYDTNKACGRSGAARTASRELVAAVRAQGDSRQMGLPL